MDSGIVIPINDAVKIKAAERALAKIAPFHLSKNSIGDAVIIEIYAEIIAETPIRKCILHFITNNTRDFSQYNGTVRLPHRDLEEFFQGNSRYAISIVEVLKEIGGDELLEEYEWRTHYLAKLGDYPKFSMPNISCFGQVWYNRHWNLRHRWRLGK